jgi:hypothetical protein
MRKSWVTLGAFFACVAALGLFVWLKPPKPQSVSHSVSALKPADARKLTVQRNGTTLAVLEKRSTEWFLIEPYTVPADAFQVSRLLAVLEAKSDLQYAPSDAAKFELNAPQAEIIINDQRFAFGAINNVTREQYVLTQNHVYPLELRFAAAIPSDAAALLRRSVLAPGETPQRFEFGAFTVAFDEKKWITTPSAGDVSQDDFNRWVAQWREGSALRAEPADKRTPEKEIRLTLKDGRKLTLGVVQTEPELIVRRADLGLQFVFVGNIGTQMIMPPTTQK